MRGFLILATLGAAAAHAWPGSFPSSPAKFGFATRRVEVELGVGVFVLDRAGADPSLPPAVFVHGCPASWHSFEKLYALIGDSRRVIAMDLRGHGNSDKPHNASYHGSMFVRDLRAVVAKLGVEKIGLLVGHSFGTLIALHFAGAWPAQVERMLLIDAVGHAIDVSTLTQLGEHPSYEFAKHVADSRGDFNASVAGQWFYDTTLYEIMLVSLPAVVKIFPIIGSWADEAVAIIPNITARTTIIRGRDDHIYTLSGSEKILTLLEQGEACQASLLEIPGQGHCPHWTNAGARVVGAAMLRLLASPPNCSHTKIAQVAFADSSLPPSGLSLPQVLVLTVGSAAAMIILVVCARSRLVLGLHAPLLEGS